MKKICCKENIKEIKCHSQRFLLGIFPIRFREGMFESLLNIGNKQAGDPRQRLSGMTVNGFTLIELLVVVLIIGILAAIALPQYQKAVAKARMMEFTAQARTLRQALQMYALTNGNAASSIEDLDIWDKGGSTGIRYLGKNQYVNIGTLFIQAAIKMPAGYLNRRIYCRFNWKGTKGKCFMEDERGVALAQSLGWEVCLGGTNNIYPYCDSSGKDYHIGRDWNR